MTVATNAVPLSRSLDIPFNKLVLSQANVRQINAGVSLDDLREDIAVRGLVQSLNVRPVLNEEGGETGKYEVPAGGRRFRALEQLVKAKRLSKTALIPCIIKGATADTSQEDDSLAENTHRVALHPLDQYRAFLALRRQNMSEEDIAARYFVSVSVVRQRLRLAAVSPKLLELYGKDEMTLDQLMAFSVTGDHFRQEHVWDAICGLQNWQRGAREIRGLLTEAAIAATDRRVVFVGLDAYEAAGGVVMRDLFSADNGGWLQDAVLLDRLVDEKLQGLAEELKGEGWKWIEVLVSLPFDHLHGLRRLDPLPVDLIEEDQAALASMKMEYQSLNEAWDLDEDLPDEVDQRLAELETAMATLEGEDNAKFDPIEVARAGVVLSLDRQGMPQILKGYVRPDDEAPFESADDSTVTSLDATQDGHPVVRETTVLTLGSTAAQATPAGDDDEGDVLRPLPEKLVMELTVFRTVALRDAVARNPHVAMTLLLHKLVSDTFQHRYGGACLSVSVFMPQIHNIMPKGLSDSAPALSMARRHELWGDIIPADDQALWDWLEDQSDSVRDELLAYCVSYGMNAVMERPNPFGAGPTQHGIDTRMKHAMRVAEATGLDLVDIGWRPTADSYLNRVPRPRILEAVREGCGDRAAQLIGHLKKGDMVVEAERLLADAAWLPEVLRGRQLEPDSQEIEALPAFFGDTADGPQIEPDIASVAAE